MNIYCLNNQESLYETNILRRIIKPDFIAAEDVHNVNSPLVLYGDWFQGDFLKGIRWLASIAYHLPYPSIVLPPYQEGPIDKLLGLSVGLDIVGLNTNLVKLKNEFPLMNRDALRIQADYGFFGSAGKTLVIADDKDIVVTLIQPNSNATPIILCGLRILSTSGLSDESDRQEFFLALVDWAQKHNPPPPEIEAVLTKHLPEVPSDRLKSLLVLLAVETTTDIDRLTTLMKSSFGQELTHDEVDQGVNEISKIGLVKIEDDKIISNVTEIEKCAQQLGLWPYLRILRHDHNLRN
jgi:hypothetical protein